MSASNWTRASGARRTGSFARGMAPIICASRVPEYGHMRVTVVSVAVLLAGAPMAANWPQWRGPSGFGVSAESGLPTTWGEREIIAWRVPLRGLGSSSPIVWGDQVFVTSQIGRVPLSGGPHPALARDDAALVAREKPLGGRREAPSGTADPIFLVVESFSRSDG